MIVFVNKDTMIRMVMMNVNVNITFWFIECSPKCYECNGQPDNCSSCNTSLNRFL